MSSASLRIGFTVALLAWTIACQAHNRGSGEKCESSDACTNGLTCADGACRTACNFNSDCATGTGCNGGLCMPATQAGCVAGACNAPPVCHDSAGQCVNDICVYTMLSDGAACMNGSTPGVCSNGDCIDCLHDADCDPRNFGLDLCSTGACVGLKCSFTAVANCTRTGLGTICANPSMCRSGYCANGHCCESVCDGTCQACGNDGHCNVAPNDDSRCGTIDCDGLDVFCRDYRDYDNVTKARCASFGTCRAPNSAASCLLFTNASGSTICRDAVQSCDQEEYCGGGTCPSDANLPTGSPCAQSTDGICTNTAQCVGLPVVSYGVRYFIEEPSVSNARSDALAGFDLAASGSGVLAISQPTGRGVRWNSTGATGLYCKALSGSGFVTTIDQATVEVVLTVPDGNSMPSSLLLGMGSTTNKLQLFVTRNTNSAAGQVTFNGVFADNNFSWTTTIGTRAVVHLVIDGGKVAASDRLQLYVDGVLLVPSTYAGTTTTISPTTTDNLCVGHAAGLDAFNGNLYYAALYLQALTPSEISEAAAHLAITDAP